jgi:hypothetical protein
MARLLITLVLAFVLLGLTWPIPVQSWRGRIPHDAAIRRERRSHLEPIVPIAACVALGILISAALEWRGP